MIRYLKLYTIALLRPSIKFRLNLFFIYNAFSLQLTMLLTPYLFIPARVLKIKFFSTNKNITLLYYTYLILGIYLSLSLIFYFF